MLQKGLDKYLKSLSRKSTEHGAKQGTEHLFEGQDGRIAARFFNARLSSVFQAVRSAENMELIAYEAMARSFSVNDTGLSILKLLEHATSDDESIQLDRLCRLLHVLNFFRQHPAPHIGLYLSVHSRLLTAVNGNHGAAFQRVLANLEIPQQRIVLQLPPITASQGWAIAHVADNYRKNGFRFAVHARNLEQAFELLETVHPHVLKLDLQSAVLQQDTKLFDRLLSISAQRQCQLILRKVDQINASRDLQALSWQSKPFGIQGNAVDIARSLLPATRTQIDLSGISTAIVNRPQQECCA